MERDPIYYGNLDIEIFKQDLSDEDRASVDNGQYPVILAQHGEFKKIHVVESELKWYTNWDAKDEDAIAQRELHGKILPIVWECSENGMIPTGIEHKVIEKESND